MNSDDGCLLCFILPPPQDTNEECSMYDSVAMYTWFSHLDEAAILGLLVMELKEEAEAKKKQKEKGLLQNSSTTATRAAQQENRFVTDILPLSTSPRDGVPSLVPHAWFPTSKLLLLPVPLRSGDPSTQRKTSTLPEFRVVELLRNLRKRECTSSEWTANRQRCRFNNPKGRS